MMDRILIADDDVNILSMLKEGLSMQGFDVQVSLDGQEAVDKAKEGTFDLLLLDINMPRLDGYEVAAEVSCAMGRRAPKILFITCAPDALDHREFLRLIGASDMIHKPFTLAELEERVRTVLRN